MARTYNHGEPHELVEGEDPWVFVRAAVSYLREQLGDEYLLWVIVRDSKGTNQMRGLEQAHAEWAADEYPLLEIFVTLTLGNMGDGYTINADHLDPSLQYSTPTFSISGDDTNEAAVTGRVQVAMEKAKRAGVKPVVMSRPTSDEAAVPEEAPIAMGTELLEAARQLKQERSFVPAPVPSAAVESDPGPGRSGLSRVMNQPWVVSVVGGLLVAGIVAVIALLR